MTTTLTVVFPVTSSVVLFSLILRLVASTTYTPACSLLMFWRLSFKFVDKTFALPSFLQVIFTGNGFAYNISALRVILSPSFADLSNILENSGPSIKTI